MANQNNPIKDSGGFPANFFVNDGGVVSKFDNTRSDESFFPWKSRKVGDDFCKTGFVATVSVVDEDTFSEGD